MAGAAVALLSTCVMSRAMARAFPCRAAAIQSVVIFSASTGSYYSLAMPDLRTAWSVKIKIKMRRQPCPPGSYALILKDRGFGSTQKPRAANWILVLP